MTLSEYIAHLQSLRVKHGPDIEVMMHRPAGLGICSAVEPELRFVCNTKRQNSQLIHLWCGAIDDEASKGKPIIKV